MEKERFYKTVIVVLLGIVLVLGLAFLLKKPAKEVKKPAPARPVKPAKAAVAKIAIVIDDVGYSSTNFPIIEAMKGYPVTFSIIPGLDYSQNAARELTAMGFQVMLHLPMEPKEKTNLEPNTIMLSMNEAQIRSIVDNAVESLPQIKGVNNHMGSRITEDEKTLTIVLNELKKKNLFFLDSFVTAKSAGWQVAQKEHIKFAKRDVFLDNSPDPAYIKQQIELVKEKASQKGQAVCIGHDRRNTLEVLRREIPEMEKEGFKLIFVSELAH